MVQRSDNVPDQDRPGQRQLGTGNSINGIPFESDISQTKKSVFPNRADADLNPEGETESDDIHARDYFDDEQERLSDPIAEAYGINQVKWSEGIEDEANPVFAEQNDEIDDARSLPEMGPIDLIEIPTPDQLDPNSADRYLQE